jgi:hypothetical protein
MRVTVATICREASGNAPTMLATLQHLSSLGLSACVADRGSSPAFIERITAMGHDVIATDNGLRGQMEAAFERAAASGSHVLYFESDKYQFATDAAVATIERYRRRGLQYAVAGRTRRRFDTFPLAQRVIEQAQSRLMSATLGIAGDWIGGPAVLPSGHVETLRESRFYGTSEHGWGVPWYLLGRAWRDGLRLGIINTATEVAPFARDEFNPGYRLSQAYSILGCFYEGAGIDFDWKDPAP